MFLSEFLLFFSLIAIALASDDDGYICNGTTTYFDPPQDLTQSVFYPTGWTEQQPPAKFAPNQRCFWTVNVPQGVYAQVVFYKLTDPGFDIAVEYPNAKIEKIANNDHMPYNFVAPRATFLMYQTNMNGAFSFKITWSTYPSLDKNTVYIASGGAPVPFTPLNQYLTLQADTRVALAGFNTKDPADMPLLRQTAVYAGGSTDGEFIGTLAQVWGSSDQVVTVNDKLTIFTFNLYKHIDYTMFVAQDYSDCSYLGRIQGYNCPETGDCPIEINSVFSPSALITVGDNSDFMKGFNYINENSTLKVFEGVISDDHLLATVTKANYEGQFPIRVNNYMKFYVLDSVRTEMILTKDADNAKWNRLSDGRKGFIHSYFYGFPSYKQDTDETFSTCDGEQTFFTLTVRNADLKPAKATLTVLVVSNGSIVYGETFSSRSPPSTPMTARGDTLKVSYTAGGESSNGFWIDYETSQDANPTVSTAPTPRSSSRLQSPVTTPKGNSLATNTQFTRAHVETTTSGVSSNIVSVICFFMILIV